MAARGADLAAPARRAGLTVNLPVTVKLVGRPTDEALARLVGAVETAVGRRLAEARRELPLGRPVVHPPESVAFTGDLPEGDRARLDAALRDAVLRAIADLPEPRPWLSTMDTLVGEPFDPAREDVARGTYAVPSYQDEGFDSLVDIFGPVAPPEVHEGPSPLEGGLILYLPGIRYIHLSSPRYAVSGSLNQVIQLGWAIFGTTPFGLVEGPIRSDRSRFWAIGTDKPVTLADLGEPVRQVEIAGEQISVMRSRGRIWTESLQAGPDRYRVVGLALLDRDPATKDRLFAWRDAAMAKAFFGQLGWEASTGASAGEPDLRPLVFADIDAGVAKVESGDTSGLQDTAERLSRLDRAAFALVPWEMKVKYIKLLLAAWTWHEQETAIVEIFASLKSDSEVDAVVAMLREAGVFDKLFDDLDSEVYSLLTTVGERFPRDRGGFSAAELVRLLQAFGLVPDSPSGALRAAATGVVAVPESIVDEAHDAVMGLVRFGADLGEAIGTIFTEPDKVVQGIVGLVELLVKVQLAQVGYPPAVEEVNKLAGMIGQKLLAGMRGAERLRVGEKILRRIKWRLIWEIASLFIGIGEIKAAIAAVGASEKLAGVLRFLAILVRLGEAVDAEAAATRLARLAAMLKAERAVFSTVDEVAELLARLPERDIRKLGRLLSRTEIKEGETLAELAARSKELHAVVEDAMAKAELLKSLSGKAGGRTDEIVEAFHALVGERGHDLEAAQRIVKAIPEGEGTRFAASLRRLPAGRLPDPAFLELLAASPRRMDALSRFGYEAFAAVHRRAAGRAEKLDQYLGALDDLERTTSPVEFRRLLDALEREDPAAWLKVENKRRALAGERVIDDWLALVAGSPQAQAGLDRLLRRDEARMMRRLLDEFGSEQEVVQALEEISRLSERQMDGLAMLDRYARRDGFEAFQDILLDAEPGHRAGLLDAIAGLRDPANPGALVVRSGFDETWRAAMQARNIPGGMGHFQTVEALVRQFPGARFELELSTVGAAGRRDMDIVMEFAGRRVDVEVKSYEVSTALGSKIRRQIRKDLVNHLGDAGGPWTDMLWRFPDPGYVANFPRVEGMFLDELNKLVLEGVVPATMTNPLATLRSRFTAAPPWKLIDILH